MPKTTGDVAPVVEADAVAWALLHDEIDQDAAQAHMTDIDASMAWKMGLAAWKAAKKNGAAFPHER